MGQNCTVCAHPARDEIDRELLRHGRFTDLARQYNLGRMALTRHYDAHLPRDLVKSQQAADAGRADDLLGELRTLYGQARGLLDKAAAAGDLRTALRGIAEARQTIELIARIEGQLRDQVAVNVIVSPQWIMIRTALMGALEPHLEARLAVAQALEALDA